MVQNEVSIESKIYNYLILNDLVNISKSAEEIIVESRSIKLYRWTGKIKLINNLWAYEVMEVKSCKNTSNKKFWVRATQIKCWNPF